MNNKIPLSTALEQQLTAASIQLEEAAQISLIAYLHLLTKWNSAYNLTAIRDPHEMISKHLIDSLVIAPFVRGKRILDLGSGAGLPGIPLAIHDPSLHITLLDSNGKKTRFLTQVKSQLALSQIEVVHTRVEDYTPALPFDCIVTRAFASMADTLKLTEHLCDQHTLFLFMKGTYPETEIAVLPDNVEMTALHPLIIPNLEGERHLICVKQK